MRSQVSYARLVIRFERSLTVPSLFCSLRLAGLRPLLRQTKVTLALHPAGSYNATHRVQH